MNDQGNAAETAENARSDIGRMVRVERHPLFLVALILFTAGAVGCFVYLSRAMHSLYQALSVQGTALQASLVSEFRKLYASEVVTAVQKHGMEATHDYKNRPHAIPLPATLTNELGKRLNQQRPGAHMRLYSDHPFPWQQAGGPRDAFQREALRALRERPNEPFYSFEDYEGVPSLRYAIADVMQKNCVHCHNSHPDSPKTDWREGDVRGVLETIRPLDREVAESYASQRSGLMFALGMSGLGLVGLVYSQFSLRRMTLRLLRTREAAVAAQQQEMESSRARELAEESNRAKSAFLATMSHELRTPLNGILGMNELLLKTELTEQQRRFVEACGTSGKSLLQHINDVLDLSKIEAGKIELDVRTCNLESFVFDVVDVFAPSAAQKGLFLKCHTDPAASVTVLCDENRLRQILINLIGNALKFTSSGGVTIRVDVAERQSRQLTIRFSVSDTGIGIPEERRDRLFSPFSQVDCSTTRRFGGTGLGLSICKQLVELMGGRIDVASRVGVGTTFWCEVPLLLGEEDSKVAVRRQLLCGTRVLAVNGVAHDRQEVVECLSAWGCRTVEVPTVRDAVETASRAEADGAPFSVVLADCELAVGDEYVLLSQLSEHSKLTIIGFGIGDDEDAITYLHQLGVRHLLRDPVRPSGLFNALTSVLSITDTRESHDAAPGASHEEQSLPLSAHVLVAEDNRINQMYVTELLKSYGCTYDLAVNGDEAVQAVRHKRYDLVLMDCQMPEMDGFTAAREIRRWETDESYPARLPIIALTANALQGDRERCLDAGMDDYLSKPVESRKLLACFHKFLGLKSDDPAGSAGQPQDRTPAAPPIDAQALRARCCDNIDFASSLLDEFESAGDESVAVIRRFVARQDAGATAEAAHALKGTAGILCATAVQHAALQIETTARAGDLEGIGSLVDGLDRELRQCLTYLPTLRRVLQTDPNAEA